MHRFPACLSSVRVHFFLDLMMLRIFFANMKRNWVSAWYRFA